MTKLIIGLTLFISTGAMASEGVAFIDTITEYLANIPDAVYPVAAIALEFLLRLVPSTKPLGIMQTIAKVLIQLGKLFGVIAALLDKVLPQNIK